MEQTMICSRCGKEFKDEIMELSPLAREVVAEMRKILPQDVLEKFENRVKKIYQAIEGLCETCQNEVIKSLKLPPEKINKKVLSAYLK